MTIYCFQSRLIALLEEYVLSSIKMEQKKIHTSLGKYSTFGNSLEICLVISKSPIYMHDEQNE